MSEPLTSIGLYHRRAPIGDGGITRSVRELSIALEKAGYKVRVIFDDTYSANSSNDWHGVRHWSAGAVSIPVRFSDALSGLDVLVTHSAWVTHNIVAARAAARLDIPYVLAPRGAYDPMIIRRKRALKKTWWQTFENSLVEDASAIHVFFESQRSHMRDIGFTGPLVVAPNGVTVPSGLTWDGGSSGVLAFVGRFDPEHKGIDVLLRGLALLPSRIRPRLVLRGPDWKGGKEKTERLVETLNLGRWVDIGPAVHGSEKWGLMISAKGFVYPSRWEAFGNSAAEAAALGVPLMTGTYPLGLYLSERGAALAATADPQNIAEALGQLCSQTARNLGQNGRVAIRAFEWDAVAASWGHQLSNIVSGLG